MDKSKYTLLIANLVLGAYFTTLPFRKIGDRYLDVIEEPLIIAGFLAGVAFLLAAYASVFRDSALTRNSAFVKFSNPIIAIIAAMSAYALLVPFLDKVL